MSTQINFRVSESQKNQIEKIINRIMSDKKLNKSDSFAYIVEQFSNMQIGNVSNDYIDPNIRDVLTQIRKECDYMGFDNDKQILVCRETMLKKKEPKLLEGSPKMVLNNCLACIKERMKEAEKEHDKLLQKESIRKLQKFMKGFIAISEKGFKYTAFMCICNSDKGEIIFSRGGDSLQCPQLDKELVDIKRTCMEKINEKTQNKPCEYLTSLEGIQNIDLSIIKDLKEILPPESFLPLREKEQDKIDEQNERLGIEVEARVIEEDNYDGECPTENDTNQSCINPKCEHSDKCDSYSPEEKWIKEPLR